MGIAAVSAGAAEVIIGDRLKIAPEIALTETYNDNIYLTDSDTMDDFITSIYPGIDIQFAFTPLSRIGMLYQGRFDYYQDADNFREDHHYGNVYLQGETAKGSAFEIGAWGEDSAKQPYAIDDHSKDYSMTAWYAEGNLAVSDITHVFANYQRSQRRFDDTVDQGDDYDRDSVAVGMVYSRSALLPLLLEYRYETQENDRSPTGPTDFDFQAAYTGFKWGQDRRLSGSLRAGYLWSEYNGTSAYDGWATDTELGYALSPYTRITGKAFRGVRESTRSERETLDYYIYAGGGLSLDYSRLAPLGFKFYAGYENRDFRSVEDATGPREDDHYVAGVTTRWRIRDWLALGVGYRYRVNDSNIDSLDYEENRVFAELTFFSGRTFKQRRSALTIDSIDYFNPFIESEE